MDGAAQEIRGYLMKTMIKVLVLPVALAGVLAGCDSIKDVRTDSYTAAPPATVVLQGTISGLGTRRPLVLRNDDGSTVTELRFFGKLGELESPFSFGSLDAGTPYNLTVASQPYGKICTITDGSGTLSTTATLHITIDCQNDPAVTRYSVGGTISPAVAAIESAKVILTTEEGVWEQPAFGQTTFQFDDVIFNSQTSLPIFTWRVTGTTEEGGTVNNCAVTNGTNDAGDSTVPPTGAVTNVAVTACAFDVRGNVAYLTPPGGSSQAIGAGGVTIGLRDFAGDPVAGATDLTVSAFGGTTTWWSGVLSHATANYDLVVTQNPTGQACIVRVFSTTSGVSSTTGSVMWLSDPLTPARFTPSGGAIRCRNLPAPANQLTGVYQRITYNTLTPAQITGRNFVTFFADGTFLFGAHVNSSTQSGVEHGFYDYNAGTGQISFSVVTDTSSGGGFSATSGFTRTSSTSFGLGGTASGVALVKTPGPTGLLSLTFNGGAETWDFEQPKSVPAEMTGPWVSADNRRTWVFNFDDTSGIHYGVNGIINIQDGCYVFDDGTALTGYYTRRGASTGCMFNSQFASGFATLDSPSVATTPLDFFGKFPGAQGALDGRPPSPNFFEVIPGSPDTLNVQGSLNGVPRGPLTTFQRAVAN